jgi:hypothetical protein
MINKKTRCMFNGNKYFFALDNISGYDYSKRKNRRRYGQGIFSTTKKRKVKD